MKEETILAGQRYQKFKLPPTAGLSGLSFSELETLKVSLSLSATSTHFIEQYKYML